MKEIFLGIYIFYNIIYVGKALNDSIDSYCYTPKEFCYANNCNMFGAMLLCVLSILIFPLTYIAYFLWRITHFERGD